MFDDILPIKEKKRTCATCKFSKPKVFILLCDLKNNTVSYTQQACEKYEEKLDKDI